MSTDTAAAVTAEPEAAGKATGADRGRAGKLREWATTQRIAHLVEWLAVVPIIAMIAEVAKAPRLQYTDYWYVLLRITNADGSLHIPGLRFLQNEHPLMLPGLLYWLDARLADGDNRVLGMVVVVIAATTVFLLRTALPKELPPMMRASMVVAMAFLIFSLHGAHNFIRSMSGSAWLLANLLVIASLLLANRGRWWPAWAVALLACMSYGTSFAVWPALAALAHLRGERWWRRLLPLGVGALVIIAWSLLKPAVDPGGTPASDLGTMLYTFLAVLGHLWTGTDSGTAVLAGAAILAVYGILAGNRIARLPVLRFWWVLGLHAVLASAMIARARIDFGTEFGLNSRYTSLSVLASIPAGVLLCYVFYRGVSRNGTKLAVTAIVAGLVGFVLGAPTAATIRAENKDHPLQAFALRMGLGDAFGATLPRNLAPRLQSMGHYPFSGDFTLGCGGPELDSMLDLSAMTPLPPADGRNPLQPAGSVDRVTPKTGASTIAGWASGDQDKVRCVVVVDESGKIVGGGLDSLARPDVAAKLVGISPNVGFTVIAPDSALSRVVVIYESSALRWTPPQAPTTGGGK